MSKPTPDTERDESEKFEKWLDRQLTGDLATGDVETELRMAVSQIRDMPNIPKDYAVKPLLRFFATHRKQLLEAVLEGAETRYCIDEGRYEADKDPYEAVPVSHI